MGKVKKDQNKGREEYVNGEPCKHEECSNKFRRLPCPYCGRTQMRGTTIIETRTGHIYLERLRSIDIKLHNELGIEQQKTAILTIYNPPKHLE